LVEPQSNILSSFWLALKSVHSTVSLPFELRCAVTTPCSPCRRTALLCRALLLAALGRSLVCRRAALLRAQSHRACLPRCSGAAVPSVDAVPAHGRGQGLLHVAAPVTAACSGQCRHVCGRLLAVLAGSGCHIRPAACRCRCCSHVVAWPVAAVPHVGQSRGGSRVEGQCGARPTVHSIYPLGRPCLYCHIVLLPCRCPPYASGCFGPTRSLSSWPPSASPDWSDATPIKESRAKFLVGSTLCT
jgi:hypothetical protein